MYENNKSVVQQTNKKGLFIMNKKLRDVSDAWDEDRWDKDLVFKTLYRNECAILKSTQSRMGVVLYA